MCTRSGFVILLIAVFVAPILSGQAAPAAEANQPTTVIRSARREVLVDLVVRDKHHRLVTDLRPEEVEIYEDGVPQKVNAFRNVAGAEQLETERNVARKISNSRGGTTETAPPSLTSLRQMNFVAVVLAEIAPLNLEFAREAVHDFLNSGNLPNTYVSIYRLNRTLRVLQFYTENQELLAKAVDGATRGMHGQDGLGTETAVIGAAFANLQALAENILSSPRADPTTQLAVRNALLDPFPTIVKDPMFSRDAAAQDVSVTLGNAILAQARIENGIKFAASLSNGMDALDCLREIVRSQENLPGRKVVLYLSDGLDFPINRGDAVENLISYANRSGVAFYTVDTRGLNVEDPMMRSLTELDRTGAVSLLQKTDPANGHKEDDDIQLTIASNRQLSLRELAESTGGFPIANTNEIAAPMQRVMEDIRAHYELAYTPTATNYDGRFRKIAVKVQRQRVTVQTRKGYFALPDLNGKPLQPFEAVALNAINARPTPTAFPYQVAVMKFKPGQNAVEHQIAFEIPLSALRVASNPKTGKAHIKASLVAVIRNAGGEVVGKIGRELTREMQNSQTALGDRILYAEPVELPAGHYEVDAAVTDEQTGQTSVKRLAVFVDPAKDFGLSSLELVRARESVTGGRTLLDPSDPGNGQIMPALSDSVSPGKPVELFFVLYPAKLQPGQDPKVMLQVLHNGKEIARRSLKLPQPEPDGSVPMMLRLSPEPGQCDIFVTAQQGTLVAQSSLSVKVE